MNLSRTNLLPSTFMVERSRPSARTTVKSSIVIPARLTALLKPWPTEHPSNSKVLYRLYSLMPTPLPAAMTLPASSSASTVKKLLPTVTVIRRRVSSLVVSLAKTNSATTTLCPWALVTSNQPLFFFVTKSQYSLPSAANFAPAAQRLATLQTKLRVCLAKVLAQL